MNRIVLDTGSIESYSTFLKVKRLPHYGFDGRTALVPDEYAHMIGIEGEIERTCMLEPSPFLFDYQRDIARMAFERGKFSIFADCGLGKTLTYFEWIRYVNEVLPSNKCILIISPLMVIPQTLGEHQRFYEHDIPIAHVPSNQLSGWLTRGTDRVGIVNYDALTNPVDRGRLGALILDESSMLKSHYGKWAAQCVQLGRGLDWKLAGTGTPAPNDRIEYANHAVLMDAFPSVNAFLAKFFVNRGQTDNRWELKAHAVQPFFRALSHWSIFLTNPATYGWKDNTEPLPPIHIHKHRIALTKEQADAAYDRTGQLFANTAGGITSRSVLSQIAKGNHRGERIPTNKYAAIRDLIDSWPDESTIIWCMYNDEQSRLEEAFPEAASVRGATPYDRQITMIDDFKAGRIRVLITKPKILGFGLNLQVATRQVFSGLQDSYESFYQAVKRSNRYGAKRALNVHIPYTDIEYPMIQNVLDKAKRVHEDTVEQERIFQNASAEYAVSH